MKTEREVESFLQAQGIAYSRVMKDGEERMRLLDTTQLPGPMREQFDERGFFIASEETNKAKGDKK